MELLFKRDQGNGKLGGINFTLWGKIELTEEEQAIVERYHFDKAIMIEVVQPSLLKTTGFLAFGVFILAYAIVAAIGSSDAGLILGVLAAGGFGYWYFNEKRETIFVSDLLHGRNFKCDNVIDLAKEEARLTGMASVLRQVMESAKHWDGTQAITIDPLQFIKSL
jgi:hypothetical protein